MDTSLQLHRYAQFVGEECISQIYDLARSLDGLHVLHFNTTSRGGGVAELLDVLVPLMDSLGVKHDWKVIQLDPASNTFTTRLIDMLQGNEPGEISEADQRRLIGTLRRASALSHPEENQADIYCVHDFQLVPLARLYLWMRPAIWFCHVDTANPNQAAKRYILQFLNDYNACTFNSREAIFPELPPGKSEVMTPSIDPFDAKHRFLSPEDGRALLARCGIDTTRPLISQISRFDRWKNPWQVIDVYRLIKQQIPGVQVALVGAMEAADDIRAQEIFKDLQAYAGDDPDIHLLSDPTLIKDNEVNAFQRYSSVILQRSTREGFGLTVTEAMWKHQPVVGTSATGLRRQIIDGQTGYIVDDTDRCAECTLTLIRKRDLWQKMGQQAHECVKNNFLFPMMLLGYLKALVKSCNARSQHNQARPYASSQKSGS